MPGASPSGYLYLLKFNNGVIKAGCTVNIATRTKQHTTEAGRYDIKIVDQWHSDYITNMRRQEGWLLSVLDQLGTRTPTGREYFRDVPFSVARYQAINLYRARSESCCCGNCVYPVDVRARAHVVGQPIGGPGPSVDVYVDLRLSCGDVIRTSLSDEDFGPEGRYPLRPGDEINVELSGPPWNGIWRGFA
ncbi:GIY-YIG nuclease family protein [Actinomadura sp. NPDC049382]|uniref:GIY-YIG nuclease family protein n=1 Tax=Actinomadura sp. NPDC049382 TaxID=3158220 RepID=UPI0034492DB9